ncbi:hypothetical protein PT015_22690 [Candidatus Mycobacterium wuenschmannii]|uniref:Intersectin-EH binding protein Ibp1 n=1 Tax=Candidatus Mycobacterium wuenschmannii TaxID=3027808 RepID=A0ABY8VX71_9MYCO|nr:hypothetical protein [Candidatus Mycobacterium wuenschmannii]WIM87610.1 hypothetical protein PT015_22690 [Candidatus Mycobacterium wuenschmannii]
MTQKPRSLGIKIPAMLVAATGVVAIGLLGAPVGHADPPNCPSGQFPASDGSGCSSVPDPTQYGCPPQDYDCMFKAGPKKN